MTDTCTDLHAEEIGTAIAALSNNSTPSSEEQVFNVMLQKGEALARTLLYIFQKSWTWGVLPDAFKMDPKVMLPKPGKVNYNTVRSYRPITL